MCFRKRTACSPPEKARGFTLIELLTVIVIVALFAAATVPIYGAWRVKLERAEVRNLLIELMRLEKIHYATQLTYTTDLENDLSASELLDDTRYRITAQACGNDIAQCVRLSAVREDPAETLTMDSRGAYTPANLWK